jgi:protein-S-isoprenylcysteine O-methyltransferase Ste14
LRKSLQGRGGRALVAVIPNEHRAAVMSAFYVVAYASASVPAVLAGVVVSHLGLQSTFEIFGSIVAGIALIVAAEAWRTRPARRRIRQEPQAQGVQHAEA